MKGDVESKFAGRKIIIGRVAHLTQPQDFHTELGRAACQFRNMCMRGCPYGAYFSTQSATLPAATKTGNLTLLADSIVSEVIFDDKAGKATGRAGHQPERPRRHQGVLCQSHFPERLGDSLDHDFDEV